MPQDEDRAPQGNVAYARLLSALRDGRLSPGDRLRETDLAQSLGVSRTPIREAIRQMEADGLVTHVPRHGATIRRLDYPEVMELYEMRAVLEGTAARVAARAASDIEIAALADMNDTLATIGNAPDAFALNRQFHAALLDAARNRFLARSIHSLQKAMMILGPTTLAAADRADQAVAEHRDVLDALTARDGDRAETAMRQHIEAAQRARLKGLRTGSDTDAYDGDLL